MINRKVFPKLVADIEKLHETVADAVDDGSRGAPLTVRLGESWTDLVRVTDDRRDPGAPPRRPSAVPFLDDMHGILQWD
jgi:hypothetical protein